jgi:AraC-like DNA-binding protein
MRYSFDDTLLQNHSGATEENALLDQAISFIQDNTESPLKIQDICQHLHISESYLHKTFAAKMNLSPNYMILLCKVKRAEQLLKTGNYSIKEISEQLCFSSQYYFSTVFKRYYGISPRLFQKSLLTPHKPTSST